MTLTSILAYLLVVFFIVGTIVNFIAPKSIRAEYARWGYPDWFHYVTAALEFATAVLLFFPGTRVAGAVVGILVMAAAAITVLRHREYTHAIAPVVVLMLTITSGWLSLSI